MVRLLLEHGAEVTTRAYSEGNPTFEHTPITLAAHLGNLEIVRLLLGPRDDEQTDLPQLARRPRLHVRDSLGRTALHHAAESGRDHVVAFLVSQGASVNATDTGGDTALHYALYRRHLSTTRLLIEARANVHVVNCDGQTAMDTAAYRVHEDGDCRLLALQAILQANPRLAPNQVARYLASRRWPVVKLLLDRGFNPDTVDSYDGCTPLWKRAHSSVGADTDEHEHIRAAQLLIDGGANVDFRDGHVGQTPLMAAAMTGSIKMMSVLLDRGASIAARDLSGMSVLGHATVRGKEDMVAFLLDHLLLRPGPDTSLREELEWRNEDGMTPLFLALHDDTTSFKVFERLLEHGYGATQVATGEGDSSALKVAIVQAELDSRILHIIIEKCSLDVNALLPDLRITPLEYAISLRSLAATKCLLEMGARVDGLEGDERPDHEAPLVTAIRACDLKIVGILLDHGADLSLALHMRPEVIHEIQEGEDAGSMTNLLAQYMTPDLRARYEL